MVGGLNRDVGNFSFYLWKLGCEKIKKCLLIINSG